MVTDGSKLPRETYYACPHCMLRLELSLESDGNDDWSFVHIKTAENEMLLSTLGSNDGSRRLGEAVSNPQATTPSKTCRHFLGYLRNHPSGLDFPDECTVCPDIVKCYINKE